MSNCIVRGLGMGGACGLAVCVSDSVCVGVSVMCVSGEVCVSVVCVSGEVCVSAVCVSVVCVAVCVRGRATSGSSGGAGGVKGELKRTA